MGSTGVGVADDGGAWFQNPAGLGAMNIKCEPDQLWAADVIGGYASAAGEDGGGLTVSAWQPQYRSGIGGGYGDLNDIGRAYGIGGGTNIKESPFSVGLSVTRIDPFGPGAFTFLNLGLMYRFEQPNKNPIRLGALIRDLTDDSDNGPFVDLGIGWPVTNNLLFAADVRDVTDEVDTQVNAGVEVTFGTTRDWVARAGLNDTPTDTNLCLGLGFQFTPEWRVDAAWVNADPDNTWMIAGGYSY